MPADRRSERSPSSAHDDEIAELRRQVALQQRALDELRREIATLRNPAFHKNENLRLSNHATPRFIRCYVEDLEHLYLPRGLVEQATAIVDEAGSRLLLTDERPEPDSLNLAFAGEFRAAQQRAVEVMSGHELGVLEAPPGTGKTVMACALIACHATPTLVLVDRKPLLAQWRERLATHLDIDAGQIGGKQCPTKIVDIAMVQTVNLRASCRPARRLPAGRDRRMPPRARPHG